MNYSLATVSSKQQLTIPKTTREQLGVKPGDRVVLTVKGGALMVAPMYRQVVAETAGGLAPLGRHRR